MDLRIFYWLNNLAARSGLSDKLIIFLADYLGYILIIIFVGLILASQISRLKKVQVLGAGIISIFISRGVITELIRFFYHRERPFVGHEIRQLLFNDKWSFPSGHAAIFFALSATVYAYNKKWGLWFLGASLIMGLARVAAGVHYPSDILAGAVIGWFCGYLVSKVVINRSRKEV